MRAVNVSAASDVTLSLAGRASPAPTAAARLSHRLHMAQCVLVGHLVRSGVCPRCDRKAIG